MKFYIHKTGGEKDMIHQYQLWFESDSQAWNAMEGDLVFDASGVIEIHAGSSVLQDWLQKPELSENGIHFSGFTLNGVPKAHRHLLFKWTQDASRTIPSIQLENYRVLKHDGLGTVLKSGDETLYIEKTASFQEPIYYNENHELEPEYLADYYELVDKNPPEAFHPFIQKNELGEMYFIYKSYDKESGIEKYRIFFEDNTYVDKEHAGIYWLKTQKKEPIEVWTYDKAGNINKEEILYPYEWTNPKLPFFEKEYYLLAFFLVLIVYIEWRRRRLNS